MTWVVGVDVGGTFTDFHAVDSASGRIERHKVSSTPDDPARAVIEGFAALFARLDARPEEIARISHGTTVGTNALIQGRGAPVALVVTEGFRDLLEIGRQIRPHMFDLQKDHPPPLVPRQRRFEAAERVTFDGSVLKPLGAAAIESVIADIEQANVRAVAVCFLFSHVNPAHEQRLGAALAAALPDVSVSLSSAVQPEFREYERLSTTVLNAYLQPVMDRYLRHFEAELSAMAPKATLGINQSAGGLMSPERARELPIRTALSGPAAGSVGAIHTARLAGTPDVITLDMGGTSADVCLIRDCAAQMTYERWIEGYPARLASVDINAVGAGGGSIAWFERDGLLKVGPQSAGAAPGPACYGLGGTEPTVTDANLVLGRLSPRGLLGGGMALDIEAARAALSPMAERLGMSVERTAHGIVGIVVANMVRAIRAISVERGHDPRDFALLPFGGAGPLHAVDVARALDIGRIVVPAAPGILCALGLIVSDLKETFVTSRTTRVTQENMADIAAMVSELNTQADAWYAAEGVPDDARRRALTLDMRYVGQNYELQVDLPADEMLDVETVSQAFFAMHEQNYGYSTPDDPVEVVNFRLTARGVLYRDEPPADSGNGAGSPQAAEFRPVWFSADEAVETPVYDRRLLRPGMSLSGPCVVEELDSTTVVFPGDAVRIDGAGNMVITLGGVV